MKTLYLHIGTAKTGTTSIQTFCGLNREILQNKGILFPVMPYAYKRISPNRNGHFLFGIITENNVRSKEKEQEVRKQGLDYIVECFKEYDNILISDESIWMATATRSKRLWSILAEHSKENNYTIKPIVYLRRQDQFLMSRYNQKLKTDTANTQRFDEFLKEMNGKHKCVMNYRQRLDYMAKFFDKKDIIVKRFDRKYFYKNDILADFLKIMDIELTDEFIPLENNSNLGISVQSGEIKRVLNKLEPISFEDNQKLLELLQECESLLPKSEVSMMPKSQITNFMRKFIEDNESIAVDYIGDGEPLFNYDYKDVPAWGYDDKNYHEELILLFAKFIDNLHKENDELKQNNIKLQNQIIQMNAKINSINNVLNAEKKFSKETRYLLKHPIKTLYNKVKNKLKGK